MYIPVEGNPYNSRSDSVQQWTASQVEHKSPIHAAQVNVHYVAQQPGFSLSPAPQTAATKKSKATGVLSRGFGTIRKATGHANRSLTTSDEAKISKPVAGSFHRSGLNSSVVMETPLNLVGLDVAQADVARYGMPDHLLSPRTPGPRSDSFSWLTNEPNSTQPSAAPAPAPPAPPAASIPKFSKSRKVVNDFDRETLFGDIIAAAQDSSWVEEAEAQAQGPVRGEDKAECNVGGIRASATMPSSFAIPAAGNPFARPHPPAVPAPLRAPLQPANLDKSLPSSPAPGSMRRQTAVHNPVSAPRRHTIGFSEALEADGGRRASYVPGVKCSDCGKMIDAVQIADHRCGRRAAQAVDHESRAPTGLSRADTYRSNYGRSERLSPATTWGCGCMESISNVQGYETGFADDGEESDVVVDTFVRGDHTSWRGVVQSGVASDVHSMRGHISGGSEEVRRSNEADAVNGWGWNSRWNGMS